MPNELIEIKPEYWLTLRDMFSNDWPKDHQGYYLVDNYVRWFKKDSNIQNLKVYSLNGDWNDGTFVIVDRYQLFIYSLDDTNIRLESLLRLLDWSKGLKISSFRQCFRPAILTVVDELKLEREYDSETYSYFISREEAKKFDTTPPLGYSIKPMSTLEHAEKANNAWPNRHIGSLFFLKRLIDWSPNLGIFDENNELIAWCFRLQAGPLGALQVDECHLRKGLGSLVTRAMAKLLADMDQDTFALVGVENTPSKRMFEKLGFKIVDHVYWLRTVPSVPFEWKD